MHRPPEKSCGYVVEARLTERYLAHKECPGSGRDKPGPHAIDTLELLEDMLVEYKGTVLVVSHDREFLNNLVTSTIVFEGDGRLTEYVGGYDDWLRQRTPEVPKATEKASKPEKPRQKKERPRILTFKETKELDALLALIEALEEERDGLYKVLAAPDLYKQDAGRVGEIKARIAEIEEEAAKAYERWEFLDSIEKGAAAPDNAP